MPTVFNLNFVHISWISKMSIFIHLKNKYTLYTWTFYTYHTIYATDPKTHKRMSPTEAKAGRI